MKKTHGMTAGEHSASSYPQIYGIWKNMKQRCLNPKNPRFADYGGRGITVCERWLVFENFLEDMGCPPPGRSLDRRENDKGYYRDNCRWATSSTQTRNSRRAVQVTIGNETMCIADWLERVGVSYATFKKRRSKYGWTLEEALTTPARAWVRKE